MDDPRFKIVFDGAVMPSTPLETVKENLARLFKSDVARIEALFSGQLVVLKRGLSAAEADKYLSALHGAGADARKEADGLSGLTLVETEDHPSDETLAARAADQAPGNENMVCPKCGCEQAKSSECSACGIIIDKYLARQAELAASEPAQAPATPAPAQSPYTPPQAQVGESLPEFGELKYFTAQGRIGRVRYLGWSMGLILALIPLFAVIAGLASVAAPVGMLLGVAVCVGMVVASVFFGVQRLHDIGWSGWLWLVNFVPLVGSVFALLMLLLPGTAGANRYGPPPPPNSRGVLLLAWGSVLLPFLVGIGAAVSIPAYQDYVKRAHNAAPYSQSQSTDPAATAGYEQDSGDAAAESDSE